MLEIDVSRGEKVILNGENSQSVLSVLKSSSKRGLTQMDADLFFLSYDHARFLTEGGSVGGGVSAGCIC